MENEAEVYIKKIRLTNCRCFEKVTLNFGAKEPGKGELTELKGENGSGKTTIRDMILELFDCSKNPGLIRNGSEAAEGLMVLSDGHLITKTMTRTTATLTIVGPDGQAVKAPVTYLKRFGTAFSRDPVAFDDGTAEDRIKILLEISDVRFEPAEILRAIGADVAKLVPPPENVIPLVAEKKGGVSYASYLKELTDRRALIGGQRDEKASSIESLRKLLPEDEEDGTRKDWAAELKRIDAELARIATAESADLQSIQLAVSGKRIGMNTAIRTAEDAINGEFKTQIGFARAGSPEEINDSLQVALIDLAQRYKKVTVLDEAERESLDAVKVRASSDREALAGARAEANAGRDAQIKAGAVREQVGTFQTACTRLTAQYAAIQTAVKNLEVLRKSKVDAALLPGMDVREDVYMNDICWPDINTADRLHISIAVCSRGIGDAWGGFFVIDGGERFGPRRRKEIEDGVVASGMQAIMCTVASKEWIAGCEACGTDGTTPNPGCARHEPRGGDIRSVPAGVLKVKK